MKDNRTASASFWRKGVRGPAIISVLLALVTLAVFWPIRAHEFVNLDDAVYVTENPHVQGGLTGANVVWAFTNLEAGFWHPLTWMSIMLDCQMYGLRAGGHHLTSLLLHAANAVLLFVLFRQMTGTTWRSAFVAALFALHPLHVESVAWAADRKDVLSTFFSLLTLITYARYSSTLNHNLTLNLNPQGREIKSKIMIKIKNRAFLHYLFALAFFVCAVMSKTMVVTLPFVLLLLDFWPLGRVSGARGQGSGSVTSVSNLTPDSSHRALLLEKIPFLAISLFAGLLTIRAESGIGALADATQFPIQFRVANAFLSCWKYLAQMFWPCDLAVFYPYPSGFSGAAVICAALSLVIVSILTLRAARTKPWLAVGWFWFLVTLLPVIGLIQVGGHAHADRYTYVALIGIFALVAWGAYDLTKHWQGQALALSIGGIGIIFACIGLTRQQISHWQNSETLFRHAIRVTRNNYLAHYNLGLYVSGQGKSAEAIENYQLALQINPAYADAHNNLGLELAMGGKIDEAIGRFRDAIRFNPRLASAHSNLGMALAAQNKWDEAIKEYVESLRLKPDEARVHSNLGNALDSQGKAEEAVGHYREALRLDPNSSEIHLNLGITLLKQGKREAAAAEFNEALRLKPDFAPALQELSKLRASEKPPAP